MFLTPGLVTSGSNSMTTLSHLHQNRKFLMNRRFSYFTSFNHWHEDVISGKPSHFTSLNLDIRSQMYFWLWDFFIFIFNGIQYRHRRRQVFQNSLLF